MDVCHYQVSALGNQRLELDVNDQHKYERQDDGEVDARFA
jgi:hypothetical protein